MDLGDRIAERLEQKGWSQAELARRIDVSQQTVWKVVAGQSQSTRHLRAIAAELGTTQEYLLGETDDPSPSGQPVAPRVERSDDVEIDEIDLRYGLGGTYLDGHVEVEKRPFSRAWLRQFTDAPPELLFWTRGQGNSMSPTIEDGEVVLIDRSQKRIEFGDLIYAFAYGEVGMMKRLRPLPDGSIEIHSDNKSLNLPPARAVDGELHLVGRVVAVVKRL